NGRDARQARNVPERDGPAAAPGSLRNVFFAPGIQDAPVLKVCMSKGRRGYPAGWPFDPKSEYTCGRSDRQNTGMKQIAYAPAGTYAIPSSCRCVLPGRIVLVALVGFDLAGLDQVFPTLELGGQE